MKDLYKLRKEEYKFGAEKTLFNSQQHYMASTVLAESGFFPFAINHIIIASEELMKALVLHIKSIDNKVAIPNLDDYFRKHKTKQDALLKVIKHANKDVSIDPTIVIFFFVFILIASLSGATTEVNDEKNDIDSIEKIRLSATYVALLHPRKWRSPEDQYGEEHYKIINELYKGIEPTFKTLFSNKMTTEDLKDFIDTILNKENEE